MDTVLGLFGLLAYIVFVVSFACAVTYAVIKISPSQSAKQASKS